MADCWRRIVFRSASHCGTVASMANATATRVHGASSDTVCDRAGITYRMLDYWCRLGVLDCIGHTTRPGSGSQRRFSRQEVRVASVVARLAELGATVQTLRMVAPLVRAMPAEEWHGELLVSRTGAVEHLRHNSAITFGEACWVVNLDLCAMRAT